MKKTLVALAAIAATSAAFAEVTITGVLETAVVNSAGNTSIAGGTNGTEIRFGVSEDLASGLKFSAGTAVLVNLNDGASAIGNNAIGRVGAPTNYTDSTTGTAAAGSVSNYNSFIGLSGEFGSVKLGQQFSPNFFVSTVGDFAGRSAVSNYAAGGLTGQVANSLTYTSPTFAGLTVSYQQVLSTKTLTAAEGKGFANWSATYSNGPLTVAYGSASNSTDGTNGGLNETVAAASYDFGLAKVHVGSSSATGKDNATGYGVSIPVAGVVIGMGAQKSGTSTANQYGVTYPLSKKTIVYVAQGNGLTKVKTTLGGIRHDF